jgi:hypothetical protein
VHTAGSAGALISALVYGQRGLPRRPVLVAYVGWTFSISVIVAYGLAQNVPEFLAFANAVGARATLVGAGAIGIVACLGPLAVFRSKLEPAGERAEP